MDNDSGWAARAITLTAPSAEGRSVEVTLPCRWVELVQAWDGAVGAYFLVSGLPPEDLPEAPWDELRFRDAAGKPHHFPIGTVSRQDGALKLMRRGDAGR
jgi:hypothetical protein